jgi:hypothetical protein
VRDLLEDQFLEAVFVDHMEAIGGLNAMDLIVLLILVGDPVLAVFAHLVVLHFT